MARIPIADPGARNANAQRHPSRPSSRGIGQIVAAVTVKPAVSCSVSAVPT